MVEGYGLLEVMGTSGVDGLKCKSNHVLEMQSTLGIEAARYTIIHEIVHTMQSHGMTIDLRHVMLLADLMSFKVSTFEYLLISICIGRNIGHHSIRNCQNER